LSTNRWGEYDEGGRHEAKEAALCLAKHLGGGGDGGAAVVAGPSARFLLRKSAALIADVAVREWPQRWPELIEQLLAMAGADDGGGSLVFLVCAAIRALVEEVHEFGHTMEPDRRRDLVKSLAECAPDYLAMLASTVRLGIDQLRSGDAPDSIVLVLTEAIDTLKPCFE
jgi:hypothetical protein